MSSPDLAEPVLLSLLGGGFVLLGVIVLRRRKAGGVSATGLSSDERQRLAQLLEQTTEDKRAP